LERTPFWQPVERKNRVPNKSDKALLQIEKAPKNTSKKKQKHFAFFTEKKKKKNLFISFQKKEQKPK
jgi:hypothetical protein